MSTVTYLSLLRAAVIRSLGPAWPAPVGSTQLRIDPAAEVTDGAVVVYETEGMPGTTWWLVDGVVPSQDAGLVTEQLAALVPGSVLETIPDPWADASPPTGTYGLDTP
ncbi:hypothetical protein [Streptomyces scopuliridis]|uniref:Uncharacterized protein n=1 Tax=Streptomyces scopuliridis RB72 TaxID=1440053 RepID=A0A2T7SP12_9ACTN|nr:hypothetical protein [Streptomyces scopuliridis]PVE04665.1 hypothetical protein Y717_10745 [Streptomyces scopuliridis RB72]